jgi:hypothetical protein
MGMKEQEYPEGIDCVWLGADRDGRIAAFVTGGAGPIPISVLDATHPPVESIEARVSQLKPVTLAHLLVELKRADDYIELAQRGIFAYDWTDVQRTKKDSLRAYELIAIPESPISAGDLPTDIIGLLAGVSLGVSFAEERRLDVSRYVACREAG